MSQRTNGPGPPLLKYAQMMLCEGVWKCLAAPADAGSASATTRAETTARRVTLNKVRRGARKGQRFLTAGEWPVVRGAQGVEHAVEHGLSLVRVDSRRLRRRLWRRRDGLRRWRGRQRFGLRQRLRLRFRFRLRFRL